jgi:hypothetical protein
MNSLSLSNFQMNEGYSCRFDQTFCCYDQNKDKIEILHVCETKENGKYEPAITKHHPSGKAYLMGGCGPRTTPDFRILLEKNLILLNRGMEMIAFSGFDKYGKIGKHFYFYGGKLLKYSQYIGSTLVHRNDNEIPVMKFSMLDKKTSESVKKSLMDIAWMFDKVSNETSQRQYESIPKNLSSSQIRQPAQPTISQTTSVSSRTKVLPIPLKPSNNTSSSTINTITTSSLIITNVTTNTFESLADFQGNNFEKDSDSPPDQLLKTAIELAKKEGFTKFAISNSFTKNIEVYPEPYTSKTNKIFHQVKVDFFIDASNNFGKSCQLILQREFFISSSDKTIVIQKITECANAILKLVPVAASTQV